MYFNVFIHVLKVEISRSNTNTTFLMPFIVSQIKCKVLKTRFWVTLCHILNAMKHVTFLRSRTTANIMIHITITSNYHIEGVPYSQQVVRFGYENQNSCISPSAPRQTYLNFYHRVAISYGIFLIWTKVICNTIDNFGQNNKMLSKIWSRKLLCVFLIPLDMKVD